jgi:hypothetical protein
LKYFSLLIFIMMSVSAQSACDSNGLPINAPVDNLVTEWCKQPTEDMAERYNTTNCKQYKLCHDARAADQNTDKLPEMIKLHGRALIEKHAKDFVKCEIIKGQLGINKDSLITLGNLLDDTKTTSDINNNCNPKLAQAKSWITEDQIKKYKEEAQNYLSKNTENKLEQIKKYLLSGKANHKDFLKKFETDDKDDPYFKFFNHSIEVLNKQNFNHFIQTLKSAKTPKKKSSLIDNLLEQPKKDMENKFCDNTPSLGRICEILTNAHNGLLDQSLAIDGFNELYQNEDEDNKELSYQRCVSFRIEERALMQEIGKVQSKYIIIPGEKTRAFKFTLSGCGVLKTNRTEKDLSTCNSENSSENSSITVNVPHTIDTITFTAIPSNNYKFSQWTGGAKCANNSTSCIQIVDSDIEIGAVLVPASQLDSAPLPSKTDAPVIAVAAVQKPDATTKPQETAPEKSSAAAATEEVKATQYDTPKTNEKIAPPSAEKSKEATEPTPTSYQSGPVSSYNPYQNQNNNVTPKPVEGNNYSLPPGDKNKNSYNLNSENGAVAENNSGTSQVSSTQAEIAAQIAKEQLKKAQLENQLLEAKINNEKQKSAIPRQDKKDDPAVEATKPLQQATAVVNNQSAENSAEPQAYQAPGSNKSQSNLAGPTTSKAAGAVAEKSASTTGSGSAAGANGITKGANTANASGRLELYITDVVNPQIEIIPGTTSDPIVLEEAEKYAQTNPSKLSYVVEGKNGVRAFWTISKDKNGVIKVVTVKLLEPKLGKKDLDKVLKSIR